MTSLCLCWSNNTFISSLNTITKWVTNQGSWCKGVMPQDEMIKTLKVLREGPNMFYGQMTDWSINSISDVRGIMTKVLHGMDKASKVVVKKIEWSVPWSLVNLSIRHCVYPAHTIRYCNDSTGTSTKHIGTKCIGTKRIGPKRIGDKTYRWQNVLLDKTYQRQNVLADLKKSNK